MKHSFWNLHFLNIVKNTLFGCVFRIPDILRLGLFLAGCFFVLFSF
jgi:hypothetical protein